MPGKTVAAPEVLADFRVSAKRAPVYVAREKAPRASVPAISDVAYVTRGAHAKTGAPVLLVQDGSAQVALSLAAIGAAIAANVITADEITALLGS